MRSLHSLQALRALRTSKTPARQIRQFHPTRPAPFVSEVLEASSGFIYGVHFISGLPWVASIPLTAIIVRMTVAMPLQMYSKIQARKEQDLAPLLTSWRHRYQRDIKSQVSSSGGEPMLANQAVAQLSRLIKEKKRTLHERWGIPRFWKPVNFLQIPVWLSIMESLRAMSGSREGLLGYLVSLVQPISYLAPSANLPVEPSLATEGAFWFPDLLAGDPTAILPIALTASILFNIRTGWKVTPLRNLAELPKMEIAIAASGRALRLFIQLMALNIGVSSYMYEMPTALLLYWITSTNTATIQSFLLDKFMFKRPALKPLKKIYMRLSKPGKGSVTPNSL